MRFDETRYPIGGFQSDYDDAEFVVIGIPYDETASFRTGCGDGPKAIREFANNLETVDPFSNRDISEILIHDVGDTMDFELVRSFIPTVRDDDKKLMVLGGEHSILEEISRHHTDKLYIVFDAHADLRDSYMENIHSHACAVRRLLDHIKPEQLIMIGLRAVSTEERDFIAEQGISVFWGHNWDDVTRDNAIKEIRQRIEKFNGLHLSVDMDGFDPAFAPGVGNPEPLGLTPKQFFDFLNLLPRIDVVDICELNPRMDHSGATSALAARLAMSILSR